MLLIGPGPVITFGEKNRVIEYGGVLIDGNTIKAVGNFDDLVAENPVFTQLDTGGRVIIPGIVNAHMHFYSTFSRGMAIKEDPPENFVQILERLWWRLDKALGEKDCYLSAAIPSLLGLRYGITSYIDHHASPFYKDRSPLGSLEEVGQAILDTGVRGCLCYEVSDRDGEVIALAGISENERFIEMCRTGHGNGRLTGMMGLHAQFTCSDETLAQARQVNDYLKAGFHVHCAEDASDTEDAKKRGFGGAVERLEANGILGDKTILAHCIHVSDKEIQMIKDSGTAVVHQPTSNMNNAVGTTQIVKIKNAGILAGVGTDGMSPNVWNDFRVSNWKTRDLAGDPRQGWMEAYELLTQGNPAIASRYFDKPVGVLKPGAYADVAVMDYYPPTPLNNDSCMGHVLFGLAYSQAWHTICNGEVVLKEGQLKLDIDEEKLSRTARECAAELWERF
ncbi:MAG: putative aminohydrolase SsnA [Candidatus Lindowbacteria bacterium]|nr:putative aminohydrolase SsnA [Candidatus Lindowbacteria bacterium]